jgi:azurin
MCRHNVAFIAALGVLGCNNAPQDSGAQPAVPAAATSVPTPAALQAPAAEAPQPEPAKPQPTQEAAASTIADDGKPVVEVHIIVSGVTMKYSITAMTAAAGQRVHVFLENQLPGTLPHNWALVVPGTEAAVAAEGLKQGPDAGYFMAGPNVLAHSDMIAPGKATDFMFNAPKQPGKYPYICTFPGHYMLMKGVLNVTP